MVQHDATIKRTGEFDDAVLVRHIVGIDPAREAVAVAQRHDRLVQRIR